jgi:hypothetical protein
MSQIIKLKTGLLQYVYSTLVKKSLPSKSHVGYFVFVSSLAR